VHLGSLFEDYSGESYYNYVTICYSHYAELLTALMQDGESLQEPIQRPLSRLRNPDLKMLNLSNGY
jgi:hypothetical protein